MSSQSLWNLAKGPDMSGLTGDFGGKIDFDDLHFTQCIPLDSTELLGYK
jgi:hypothetical protein